MKKNLKKNFSKEFLLEFFRESKIKEDGGILTVENVPADFEDFIGKK